MLVSATCLFLAPRAMSSITIEEDATSTFHYKGASGIGNPMSCRMFYQNKASGGII